MATNRSIKKKSNNNESNSIESPRIGSPRIRSPRIGSPRIGSPRTITKKSQHQNDSYQNDSYQNDEPTIEEIYKHKTHHEHILSEPDSYLGSTICSIDEMWVFDKETDKIVLKDITYPPGLYKINDELYVNARDHSVKDNTCKNIRINIDQKNNTIIVCNDGNGIRIEIHKDANIYVPEMIFSRLLTSTHYDTQGKTVGGKNGYGAKLANIYSREFIVETVDMKTKKKYIQKFCDNMYTINPPVITTVANNTTPYTKITFKPDLEKFGVDKLTDDIVSLLTKRVYDLAACTDNDVNVYLNDKLIQIQSFEDYIKYYYDKLPSNLVYQQFNDRWKVGILFDPECGFRQISFVNGICTYQGGTHVNHVLDQLSKEIIAYIKEKYKNVNIKTSYIKENITLFIDSIIEDPKFKSQTKEELISKVSSFGSRCEITKDFIKKIVKTGVIEEVVRLAAFKTQSELSRTDYKKGGSLKDIVKLDDAHWAETAKSKLCRLILTEGDSAKAFAVAGLSIIGKERFGVFPLRGKFLNVREATAKQLLDNEEFKNIKRILGLRQGRKYKNCNNLRYGGIIILTDQDSVSGDTPLLLRKNNKIYIKTIDSIGGFQGNHTQQKEYARTDFEVWTDNGWTSINKIMRHRVTKRMYRIVTQSGVVDVTEDHSLLDKNGNKIAPLKCDTDTQLLHAFPKFEKNINNVFLDETFVMGLFFIAGRCCRTTMTWEICDKNKLPLLIAQYIMNKLYGHSLGGDYFEIIDVSDIAETRYKLTVDSCINLSIIEKYQKMFYKDNIKYVPQCVLNGCNDTRNTFFKGCSSIDAQFIDSLIIDSIDSSIGIMELYNKIIERSNFNINGKIGAMGLFYIIKSLGYNVLIDHSIENPDIYTLIVKDCDSIESSSQKIKEIIELDVVQQYVYDLETENHHFHAGVGEMIVHNTDGSHIKGLLINMLATYWPSLLKLDGYVQCMSTPIVKAFKKTDIKKCDPICFYTITDYKNWIENDLKGDTSKHHIKYYKGLGTSTLLEAKQVFNEFENMLIKYVWETAEDVDIDKSDKECTNSDADEIDNDDDNNDLHSKSYQRIHFAFAKSQANERKKWLFHYNKNNILSLDNKEVPYSDFIDKELIHFSAYSNQRSIPSVIDGLKPSQRKILFGCFKKKIINEIRVAQIGAYIAEKTLYHHGEESLYKTIIGMAQNFTGSNNINLLLPNGNFGTRREGGDDYSSPRYIYTQINDLTKLIFKRDDENTYTYIDEDGTKVEPERYAPIIPMVLVNGTQGIGTGFSTKIPSYNPKDIVENIRLLLNDEDQKEMTPWYRGFKGEIKMLKYGRYQVSGIYEIMDDHTIKITELPIGSWIDKYKIYLDDVSIDSKSKIKHKFVKSYINNCSNNTVEFIITLVEDEMQNLIKSRTLEKKLNLIKYISLNNMYLHNSKGNITKYVAIEDIISEFYKYRYNVYVKRKEYVLKHYVNELKILENKVRFIEYVLSKKIKIEKRKENDIIQDLVTYEFEELSHNMEKVSYNYLTDMKLFSLTSNKIDDLIQERDKKKKEYDIYKNMTIKEIYTKELDEFITEYNKWLLVCIDEEDDDANNGRKNKKTRATKGGNRTKNIDIVGKRKGIIRVKGKNPSN